MGKQAQLAGEPTQTGRFGEFGGRFVPETLIPALEAVEGSFRSAWADATFRTEHASVLRDYVGRPTPVTECGRLSDELGVRLLLKREDLTHSGSHKINNAVGQVLLARLHGQTKSGRRNRSRSTRSSNRHSSVLFSVSECVVYMGSVDVERQALNVFRMELIGARVIPVVTGSCTLKDAVSEAFRAWLETVETTYFCLGSAMGPHPYPWMVREFQRVIGDEARSQCRPFLGDTAPDYVIACVGGGSNALGTFAGFVDSTSQLVGVEADGGAALGRGIPGVVHGSKSLLLQDEFGQVMEAHSISAGLDYPGVGPEHAQLQSIGRARYVSVGDDEVIEAFRTLARREGILAALEPAHAIAYVLRATRSGEIPSGSTVLVTLSGRGDKDVNTVKGVLDGNG